MGNTPVLILFSPWPTFICQVMKFVKHNLRLRFPTLLKIVCFNPSSHVTVKNITNFMPHGVKWTGWIFGHAYFWNYLAKYIKNLSSFMSPYCVCA